MQSQTSHKPYLIDVSKSWHIGWWATILGVSEDALLDAIALVGNDSDAVEAYLAPAGRESSITERQARCHRRCRWLPRAVDHPPSKATGGAVRSGGTGVARAHPQSASRKLLRPHRYCCTAVAISCLSRQRQSGALT